MTYSNRDKPNCERRPFAQFCRALRRMYGIIIHWIDDFLSTSPDHREGQIIPIRTDQRKTTRKVTFFEGPDVVVRILFLMMLMLLIALGLNRLSLP